MRTLEFTRHLRTSARTAAVLASTATAALGLSACAGTSSGASSSFVLGYQQGLGSAVVVVMEQSGCLAEAVPDANVDFKQFNSGAAIRDSMLAGEVQAGAIGLAPFLVGFDKGVDWQAVTPLNEMDFRLMATQSDLRSLNDFADSGTKIAVPAPDSIQAIVLREAARSELGDDSALDTNMVAMSHPDAMQALLSEQVAGHLASAPFSYLEESQGARVVLSSGSVFGGPVNNTLVAMREEVLKAQPEVAEAVQECADEAKALLETDHAAAAVHLAEASGGKQDRSQIESHLAEPDLTWPDEIRGIDAVAEVMVDVGLIEEAPNESDVLYQD